MEKASTIVLHSSETHFLPPSDFTNKRQPDAIGSSLTMVKGSYKTMDLKKSRGLMKCQMGSFRFSNAYFNQRGGRPFKVMAMTTEEEPTDPTEAVLVTLQGFKDTVQDTWDKTENKLPIAIIGFASFVAIWSSTGLISAVDKLPIIPDFLELIGILFSGWFIYRNLLFKPDREKLVKMVEDTLREIL